MKPSYREAVATANRIALDDLEEEYQTAMRDALHPTWSGEIRVLISIDHGKVAATKVAIDRAFDIPGISPPEHTHQVTPSPRA